MTDILNINGLCKSFGKKQVLHDLSMQLERGKVYGLLGKNGEGKTTLIRTLMGVIPSDKGEIFYKGKKIGYKDTAYKREIGLIPEDSIFYGWMSIADLLSFNAAFFPKWSEGKASSYISKFKLEPKSKIRNLSRGMKLKLGFIVALAAQPEFLILDDPTSGLDVPTRHDFLRNIIQEILDAGTTILFSTHLVHEIEGIIDTLAILHGGRLILEEDYETVKNSTRCVRLVGPQSVLSELHIEGTISKNVNDNQGEWVVYPWSEDKKRIVETTNPESMEISALDLEEMFISFVSE